MGSVAAGARGGDVHRSSHRGPVEAQNGMDGSQGAVTYAGQLLAVSCWQQRFGITSQHLDATAFLCDAIFLDPSGIFTHSGCDGVLLPATA